MVLYEIDVLNSSSLEPLSFFSLRTIIFAALCTFLTALLSFLILSVCARIFGKEPTKGPKSLTSSELHQPPRRTFLVSLIDRWIIVLRHYLGRSGLDRLMGMTLNAEALMSLAKRDTGLSDFGPDFESSYAALKMLCKSAETESDLTPIGQFFLAHRLRGALRNRLRAEELFKRHPEILTQEVDGPLIITGLPRTGTTLLHRLIAKDPAFRSLALWEALNPAPTPDFDPSSIIEEEHPKKKRNCGGFWCWVWGKGLRWVRSTLGIHDPQAKTVDPRLDEGHSYAFVFKYVAPNAFAIHPCELDKPEEEAVVMDMTFMTQLSEALYRVPTYSAWLEKQDPMPMYSLLKRMLQLLQWQRPGLHKKVRWILKTPNHLEWLDTLFKVFPTAQIIETHRDAKECLVSAFSASCHARRLFSDVCDPKEVAQHWLAKTIYMLKRGKVVRQDVEHHQLEDKREGKEESDQTQHFIDVQYRDLVKDPITAVRKIYSVAQRTLSKDAEDAMREFLAEKSIHEKYGKHEYNAEDFGIDLDNLSPEVTALFA